MPSYNPNSSPSISDMWILMLVVQQSKMDNTEYRRVGHRRSLSENKLTNRQSSERYVIKTKNFVIDCNAKDTFQQLKKLKIKSGIPYLEMDHKRAESRAGSSFKSLNKPTPQKPLSKQEKEQQQRKRVEQLKRKAAAQTSLANKRKSIETRRRKDEIKQMQQQIQQQNEQRKKLRTINLKRQKTAVSLIFEDRKESANMMKRSRLNRTKSQQSLADQSLRETTKNFQYTSEKKRLERQRLKYEIEYHKAFLRNQPKPKQAIPDPVFYQTLREKSKKLTQLYGGGVHYSSNPKGKGMTSQPKTQKEKQLDLGRQMRITSIKPVVFQPVTLMNPKANRKGNNPQQVQMNQCIKQSIQAKLHPTVPTKPQNPPVPSTTNTNQPSSSLLPQNIQTPLPLPSQQIQDPPIPSS